MVYIPWSVGSTYIYYPPYTYACKSKQPSVHLSVILPCHTQPDNGIVSASINFKFLEMIITDIHWHTTTQV